MAAITYETVPDAWKYPQGPYRQAPAEYGGRWWLVNPFTQAEPWLLEAPVKELPAGFVKIFKAEPRPGEYPNRAAYQAARTLWLQDLRFFKQTGVPPWADSAKVQAGAKVLVAWGLGPVWFYEGRYGWLARFPDSPLWRLDFSAFNSIELPHLTVAAYQIRLAEAGGEIGERHPFVPKEIAGQA